MKTSAAAALGLAVALTLSFVAPQDPAPKPAAADAAKTAAADVVKAQLPSYPLATCPISGEKLGGMGKPVDHVLGGRLIRLCCKSCVGNVDQDPEAVIAKINAAVVAAQKPSYPLDACPISGEKLGATAVDHVVGTRLVRTCCPKCAKKIDESPRPTLEKIDAALIAAQRASYPMKTCVISGEELGDDAVDTLYGTRLVRFCCPKCVGQFEKDPQKYLADMPAPGAAAPTPVKGGAQQPQKK